MATLKKVYMSPETVSEQFLGLTGMLMDSAEFGKNDGLPGEFTLPQRKVF